MLIIKLALRNLKRNTRKTMLLATLIAAGMAFLFFANALFESTNQGLEISYVKSLTGDVVLGAESETNFSLFGNEIPVIGEYEIIPAIAGYIGIKEKFSELFRAESYTPVVSAAAALEKEAFRTAVPVFGIEPETYFDVCSDITIEKGNPADIANGGIFITPQLLERIEKSLSRQLEIGEDLQMSMYSDGSFRIRKGFFAGVHSYVNTTQPFDRVVLADPVIVRSLVNYTLGYAVSGEEESVETDDFDMDDLFADAADSFETPEGGEFSVSEIEEILSETEERDALVVTESAAWSFVLFRAKEGSSPALRRELSEAASENGWGVRVFDWRSAAGLSAQAVFALQAAFNAGMFFIALGAVLVIMNALVISVLERSSEIGTMRGIGAGKNFIRSLFISESMILTLSAASAGLIAGVIAALFASESGIPLENDLLISLFGGNMIKPFVSLKGIFLHLAGAAVVGSLSWIYPVSVAMKIQPVEVMGRE